MAVAAFALSVFWELLEPVASGLVVLVAVVAFGLASSRQVSSEGTRLAPDFTLPGTDGEQLGDLAVAGGVDDGVRRRKLAAAYLVKSLQLLHPGSLLGIVADQPLQLVDLLFGKPPLGIIKRSGSLLVFVEDEAAGGNVMPDSMERSIARQSRNACTPDVATELARIWYETDVRGILPTVQTPTLLLVHEGRTSGVEEAHYIADLMPAAEVRVMPGEAWSIDEQPAWIAEIRRFLGEDLPVPSSDSVLATVVFTDIDDSFVVEDNSASGEEGAVYYLTNHQDTWSEWLSEAARQNTLINDLKGYQMASVAKNVTLGVPGGVFSGAEPLNIQAYEEGEEDLG